MTAAVERAVERAVVRRGAAACRCSLARWRVDVTAMVVREDFHGVAFDREVGYSTTPWGLLKEALSAAWGKRG